MAAASHIGPVLQRPHRARRVQPKKEAGGRRDRLGSAQARSARPLLV